MLRIAHYRAWIYILNFVLISLQLVLVQLIALVAADPRLSLFPVDDVYLLLVLLFGSIGLQFLVCLCGILGVFFSKEHVIRLYWLLMIPLITIDVVQAIFWADAFAQLHQGFEKELPLTIQHMAAANMQSYSQVCNSWKELQNDLSCCPPPAVLSTCQDLPASCPTGQTLCHYALLRWLHSNTDLLAAIIYFFLFPLKLIIVVMLREDISELLAEILHLHNRQTYRHWLLDAETQEDESSGCDSQGNSKLSSPADYETVLLPRGRNGSIARL